MPASDPMEILLAHDAWATDEILKACQLLTETQFHQPFEMGPGSLHNTVSHILGAIIRWSDTLAGRSSGPRFEETRRDVAQLRQALTDITREFARLAHADPVNQVVTRHIGGQAYHLTRGVVIVHVTTHSMHHRAQCLNMLRHLGVQPLPPSSVTEWAKLTGNLP